MLEGGVFIYPAPLNYRGRHRFYRRRFGRRLILFLLLVALVTGGIGLTGSLFFSHCWQSGKDKLIAWFIRDPKRLMCTAMPVISLMETEKVITGNRRYFTGSLERLPGIDLRGPRFILRSGIPLLAQVKLPETKASETVLAITPPSQDNPEEKQAVTLTEDCLVVVYNTHTAETYALTDGVERLDGKRGGVTLAARALKQALEEKYGIKTAYSDEIHDVNYNRSYIESKKTAQALIAAHPKVEVVLDIHRDSHKPRELSVVEINGQKAARILIVVGSDAREPFPNWQANLAFARKLEEKANELYPELFLGVRVKEGRYNQYLHPQSVLLEIGSVNNTTAEAMYSARLIADILAEIIIKNDSTHK